MDFDWSNKKGTGAADGWAKHKPMNDEELLYEQVQMTTAATPGTTVWVYRNTVSAHMATRGKMSHSSPMASLSR